MTVVVDFTVPADAFFLGRVLSVDPGYTITLIELVPIGEGAVPYFWVENHERGFAAFEERVRSHELVSTLTALDTHQNRIMYRIEWVEDVDGLIDELRSLGVSLQSAEGSTDRWRFRALFDGHGTLSAFREYCVDREIPLAVERVYNPTPPDDEPPYGLTGDQFEAMRLAFDEGYFEIPRQTTLTELGEELGISRQAVSNRLRRGMAQLFVQTIVGGQ